jgi:DNA-binding IscR family transcriptional regulator
MPERDARHQATTRSDGRSLKSTDTGVRILTALADADGPLSLTDLATRTGAGASTAHRHLAGFVAAGLVRQDQSGGTYDLGPAALQIGLAALARLDIIGLAEPKLRSSENREQADLPTLTSWTNFGRAGLSKSMEQLFLACAPWPAQYWICKVRPLP